MRSIPKAALALGVLLIAFACLSIYLYLELGQQSESLDSARANLAASQSANTVLQEEKANLEESLSDAQAQSAALVQANDGLAQANDGLARDKVVLEGNIAEALDAVEEWSVAYEESQEALETSRTAYEASQGALQASRTAYTELRTEHTGLDARHSSLTAEHRRLSLSHDELNQDYGDLVADYSALEATLDDLNARHSGLVDQHDELERRAGVLADLAEQIAALEAEIRELEERRRPLILAPSDTYWTWHRCTGSMEPAYGCLDELLHLTDFAIGDITVGTVIGYNPGCNGRPRGASHRVMDIKVIDGEPHYWPKGDSNLRPDGCWVPHSDVLYYLIDIRRNVFPENTELWEAVNSSREAYYAALDIRDAALEAHDDVYIRHCGSASPRCTLPSRAAFEEAVAAWKVYEEARDAANALYETRRCWHDVARDSKRPGHIPRRCD